jgi:hypothetical protein
MAEENDIDFGHEEYQGKENDHLENEEEVAVYLDKYEMEEILNSLNRTADADTLNGRLVRDIVAIKLEMALKLL